MKKLYDGSLQKNFFIFSLPLVFSAILSQGYHIINTLMVGALINDNAISAIGSTSSFISLISSVFWGYSTGVSIYVAMLFGKGDYKKLINIIKLNLILSCAAILLISALCIIFHVPLFEFLNIDSEIYKDSLLYFSIYISGLIFLHINWTGMYVSNAVGVSKVPFILSLISNILNISCNFIFIKCFGMGVEGTALATVFSGICISTIYFLLFNIFKKQVLKEKSPLNFDKEEVKQSLSFAFPTMLQQSVMYFSATLVSPFTNSCGPAAIAGYTVGMRLYDLNAAVYQNSNKTISNFVAQCIGAEKFSMIKHGIKTGLFQTLLFLTPILGVTVIFSTPISKLFLDTPESIEYAHIFMRFCMIFVVFNVINNLMHAVFRSVGAGRLLVLSTFVYGISRYIFSLVLFNHWEMLGIYAAIVLAWITEAIFGISIYISGKWKHKYEDKEW